MCEHHANMLIMETANNCLGSVVRGIAIFIFYLEFNSILSCFPIIQRMKRLHENVPIATA